MKIKRKMKKKIYLVSLTKDEFLTTLNILHKQMNSSSKLNPKFSNIISEIIYKFDKEK